MKRPDGRNFEMDILLWVNGDLYWWEAKAGEYLQEHLDRYREIRQELGLESKNCTLILGNLPREQDAVRLENHTGFKIISPHHIPHRVEEIEGLHVLPSELSNGGKCVFKVE